jgi:hypothetical protein
MGGHHPISWGPTQKNSRERVIFSLSPSPSQNLSLPLSPFFPPRTGTLFIACPLTSELRLSGLWTVGVFQDSLEYSDLEPWTKNFTTGLPGSEAFRLGLSLVIGMPRSPH